MSSIDMVFLSIAIILLFTKVFGLLTKKLHLPQVVGALLAGIALGPSLLGIVEFTDGLELLAEMGVVILLFNAGLETDLKVMKESLGKYLIIGCIEVALSLAMGWVFALFFGFDTMQAMFMGVLLTATSLGITVEALQEMGKVKSLAGASILGIAVVDDILGIIILTIALNLGGSADGTAISFGAFAIILIKIAVFFVFALLFGVLVNIVFTKLYKIYGNKHRFTILSLAFCFFMAFAAEGFGLADITGAYLAGLALSTARPAHYVECKTNVISYALFSPIFFASIGLKTDLHELTSAILIFAIGFLIVACLSKFIGNFAGAKLTGFSTKNAIIIGIGMISRGEVTLIMADKGVNVGLLSELYFPAVILMVIGTTLITPLLLTYVFKQKHPGEKMPVSPY